MTLTARAQMPPSVPEGPATRTPADTPLYDPRPLLPGLPLDERGIPSYADPRYTNRISPQTGREEELVRNINDGFIFVKGSTYLMGGDERSLQTAPHRVMVDDYWISPYEVYWKLWDDVLRWAVARGYRFLSTGNVMGLDQFDNFDKPVAMVSWYDALVWMNAYSELRQLQPVYLVNSTVFRYVLRSAVELGLTDRVHVRWRANGYRLPTEAEWEFAARGGLSGRATLYAGSNNPRDVGWFKDNVPQRRIQPAGVLYRNGLGLYDMSGNLAEWCWDWYQQDYYYQSPAVNPRGPGSGRKRVVRGGSWQEGQEAMLVASRQAAFPKTLNLKIGFRPVRRAIYRSMQTGGASSRSSTSPTTSGGEAGQPSSPTDRPGGTDASASGGADSRQGTEEEGGQGRSKLIYSLYSPSLLPYNEEDAYR